MLEYVNTMKCSFILSHLFFWGGGGGGGRCFSNIHYGDGRLEHSVSEGRYPLPDYRPRILGGSVPAFFDQSK